MGGVVQRDLDLAGVRRIPRHPQAGLPADHRSVPAPATQGIGLTLHRLLGQEDRDGLIGARAVAADDLKATVLHPERIYAGSRGSANDTHSAPRRAVDRARARVALR